MQRIAMFLAILGAGASAALIGGCKSPPTQSEMAAYDYGPRPENYEQLTRGYLWPKLPDQGSAIVEFKAGPKQLFQQETALRPLRYGWGVCVWINDKNTRGVYDGPYPMVFSSATGRSSRRTAGRTTTSSAGATRAPGATSSARRFGRPDRTARALPHGDLRRDLDRPRVAHRVPISSADPRRTRGP